MASLEGFLKRQASNDKCDCQAIREIASMPDSPLRKHESGLHVFVFNTPSGPGEISLWFCPLCGGVLSDLHDMALELPENGETVTWGPTFVVQRPKWLQWLRWFRLYKGNSNDAEEV